MAIRLGTLSGGPISDNGLPLGHKLFFLVIAVTFFPSNAQTSAVPETITFGGDATYPPFEWLHKGEAKGFTVDLAKAMGKAGGARVMHKLDDWPDVISGLENGRLDVVAMFTSQKRAEKFAFSSPFYIVSHAIYASTSAEPVYVAKELAGLPVAVEDRSYAQQQFREMEIDIVPVLTTDTLDALNTIQEGRATYAVLAIPSADQLIRDLGLPLRKLGQWQGCHL